MQQGTRYFTRGDQSLGNLNDMRSIKDYCHIIWRHEEEGRENCLANVL